MLPDRLNAYRSAAKLEEHLGCPDDPAGVFSFAASLEADEREQSPEPAIRRLREWGLTEHLIPTARGGRWRSVEELLALLRCMARRDLTAAFHFGPSLLGALPVWIAGDEEQQGRVADLVRAGGGLALANTERAHGTDVLANQTRATPCEGGYRLTGEKWLISNATRCDAWTVFARTGEGPGPESFSLFLVEKGRTDPAAWSHLPKVPTLGLRGGDLSGVCFRRCRVPASCLVGRAGAGFALLHRTLTVTRTLCAGLSLGAADTALRLTADFARSRRLFGGTVLGLPLPRRLLGGAFIDLLTGDAVATAAARAVQVGESPVLASALTKFFVPSLAERLVRDLSVVLGARFYLRAGHRWATFQKVVRDVAIVSVFEGNTLVNLSLLAAQLVRQRGPAIAPPARARLEALFRLDRPQAPLEPRRLGLDRRGDDLPVAGLALAEEALAEARREGSVAGDTLDALAAQLRRLDKQLWTCREALALGRTHWTGKAGALSPELAAATRRYCRLHAAAVCWQLWCHNRDVLGAFFRRGDWLVLALERLLSPGEGDLPSFCAGHEDRVLQELEERCRAGRGLGLVPLALAERREGAGMKVRSTEY